MSNRAMAQQYMAGGGGNSTMPQGLDLFGVKHRRQLETMRVQTDLQKELESHHAELEKQIQEANEKMAEKLRNNSTMLKAAEEAKMPIDEYVKQMLDGNIKNAKIGQTNDYRRLMNAGGALDQDQNPNIREANNRGANAAAMGIDLNKLGNTVVPPGSVAQMPNIPGNPMDVLTGGTMNDITKNMGAYPMKMPDGTIQMVGGHPVEEKHTTAGRITRGMQPVSGNELPPTPAGNDGQFQQEPSSQGMPFGMYGSAQTNRNTTMPGGPSLSNGPMFNDEADRNSVAPTPANQLQPNGAQNLSTTPADYLQKMFRELYQSMKYMPPAY